MKTVLLLPVVLLLQVAVMVAVYGSHVFGIHASGLLGLATWLLLPLVCSSLACAKLLKGSAWVNSGGSPNAMTVTMSIGLSLSALFVGVFVCLNAFGE